METVTHCCGSYGVRGPLGSEVKVLYMTDKQFNRLVSSCKGQSLTVLTLSDRKHSFGGADCLLGDSSPVELLTGREEDDKVHQQTQSQKHMLKLKYQNKSSIFDLYL